MPKNIFPAIFIALLALVFLNNCAEDSKDSQLSHDKPQEKKASVTKSPERKPRSAKAVVKPVSQLGGVMAEPVNFSTPQDIENTFKAIETDAGATVAGQVENTIAYMLVYDLSVNHDKQKLYQKLNGKTPNEILNMTKR